MQKSYQANALYLQMGNLEPIETHKPKSLIGFELDPIDHDQNYTLMKYLKFAIGIFNLEAVLYQ